MSETIDKVVIELMPCPRCTEEKLSIAKVQSEISREMWFTFICQVCNFMAYKINKDNFLKVVEQADDTSDITFGSIVKSQSI
jgi:transcription elongation factor Elf1